MPLDVELHLLRDGPQCQVPLRLGHSVRVVDGDVVDCVQGVVGAHLLHKVAEARGARVEDVLERLKRRK